MDIGDCHWHNRPMPKPTVPLALTPEQLALVASMEVRILKLVIRCHVFAEHREDVAQLCRIALCRAAQQYDPQHGRWSPYAWSAMRHAIGNHYARQSMKKRGGGWARLEEHRTVHATSVPLDAASEDHGMDAVEAAVEAMKAPEPAWTPPMDPIALAELTDLTPAMWTMVRYALAGDTCTEIAEQTGTTRQNVSALTLRAAERMNKRWLRLTAAP